MIEMSTRDWRQKRPLSLVGKHSIGDQSSEKKGHFVTTQVWVQSKDKLHLQTEELVDNLVQGSRGRKVFPTQSARPSQDWKIMGNLLGLESSPSKLSSSSLCVSISVSMRNLQGKQSIIGEFMIWMKSASCVEGAMNESSKSWRQLLQQQQKARYIYKDRKNVLLARNGKKCRQRFLFGHKGKVTNQSMQPIYLLIYAILSNQKYSHDVPRLFVSTNLKDIPVRFHC